MAEEDREGHIINLQSRTLRLVQQFLSESGYTQALASLESECGVKFEEHEDELGGELLSLVQENIDFLASEADSRTREDPDLLIRGDGRFARHLLKTVEKVHSGNIITVRFCPSDAEEHLLATSGSDKTVAVVRCDTGAVTARFTVPSSAISLDWCAQRPTLLIAGTLSGTVHVFDTAGCKELLALPGHRKFCVAARWIRGGDAFITAGHDRSVMLYRRKEGTEEFETEHEWNFTGPIECLTLTHNGEKAVVSVREDNYLHVLDLASHGEETVNMNAAGDDHVSFTALDLSYTSDDKYILVSTDKDRLLMISTATGKIVRNFYGVSNDEYSNPRHVWDPSGRYFYSTCQDNKVHVLEVATQKRVCMLDGHRKVVRSIDFDIKRGILATGSYDSTIRLWSA